MSAEGTVAYLRQSVTKEDARAQTLATPDAQVDQDLKRQRIAVDNWAKSKKLVIAHYYVDTNAKRSEAENIVKRPQFNKMMKDAKAGRFDIIIVSEQSRFGTPDVWAFASYVKDLRDWGIKLIEARTGNDLTPAGTAFGPVLQGVVGSIASTAELQDKASQTLTGKIAKVSTQGQWMGGPIMFGTSVTNYAPDGTEVWHQETIPGGTGFQYQITYPDGRVIVRDQSCKDKSRRDIPRVEPSRIPGRVEAIQEMFRLFVKGVGCNTIARKLNDLGYRTHRGQPFYAMFVHNLVDRGFIFTGVYAYGKQACGKYGNHSTGTEYCMVDNLHGKTTQKPPETWLTYQCGWEPVISPETWEQARKRLASKEAAPRSSQDWAVYSRLVICSHCGKPMVASASPSGKLYCCATYRRWGFGSQTGCGCNQVKQETIDRFLKRYLEDYALALSFATSKSPLKALFETIEKDRKKDISVKRLVWDGIESYLYARLAEYFPFKQKGKRRVFEVSLGIGTEHEDNDPVQVTLPGCESAHVLESLISLVEHSDRCRYSGELEALTARHDKLTGLFVEAPALMRDKLVVEAKELEQKIQSIRERMTSFTSDYTAAMNRLASSYNKAKAARSKLDEEGPEVRREALRELLRSIKLSFRWVKQKGRRCSVLDEVTFEPLVGDVRAYPAGESMPPRS